MHSKALCYVIVNFGGPRNLDEVYPFLEALLTDQDVIQTNFPKALHNFLFKRVAKKRALKVSEDYQLMGGKSPIYGDTEAVAEALRQDIEHPILTFHRYLPSTHEEFLNKIKKLTCDEVRIFPMFPQFSYATSGSIARWFKNNLPYSLVNKMRWIKSYPAHPVFIETHQKHIVRFLQTHQLKEEEVVFLFSAHGVPKRFVLKGDPYKSECLASFEKVSAAFPKALSRLCYQSRFDSEEWLQPYTIDACQKINSWHEGRKHVLFIPISFTSDHIETLCEIEKDYMPIITEQGLQAWRVPALNLESNWIHTILEILKETNLCTNQMLIRPT